jgi:hypothetical protein
MFFSFSSLPPSFFVLINDNVEIVVASRAFLMCVICLRSIWLSLSAYYQCCTPEIRARVHSPLNLCGLFPGCGSTLPRIVFAKICAWLHVRSVCRTLQYNLQEKNTHKIGSLELAKKSRRPRPRRSVMRARACVNLGIPLTENFSLTSIF